MAPSHRAIYKVRFSPVHGKGLFALDNIDPGALILQEAPFLKPDK